ncbi:MAG: deoxyhypusine synthase family protein [Thermoplasmata archaeon]
MVSKRELLSRELRHIDLERAETIADLVEQFKGGSFQSRSLGTAAVILEKALLDPDRPTIFLGAAGALVPGGMRKVLRDMIHYGMVDVVVTTGAIAYHDFYEALGHHHYMGHPDMDDVLLREHFIDRVYDTLADEAVFREIDEMIAEIADGLESRAYSSREFMEILGQRLKDENSIVYTASKQGVPYFVPTYHDSGIGIGLTSHYARRSSRGKEPVRIDLVRDNYEMAQINYKSTKTAEFLVGGGVPKNYIQQSEVTAETLGHSPRGYHYAIQLTTDVPYWGGLSGCTFEESKSWGKIHAEAKSVQVYVEASIGLPLIVGYILQRGVCKRRKRRRFTWKGRELVGLE